MKIVLTLIFLTCTTLLFGQGFDRTYAGQWAYNTNGIDRRFDFKSNGTFQVSNLETGGIYKGKYKVFGDTIQILRGYKKTGGTINQYYLMRGDSVIIDLHSRYDYAICKQASCRGNYHRCQVQKIKYPQTKAKNQAEIKKLEKLLNMAFNSKEVKYDFDMSYHFEADSKKRELLIWDYHFLEATIRLDTTKAVFTKKHDVWNEFHTEITDINLNKNSCYLDFKLNGTRFIFFFNKKRWGRWEYTLHDT